LPFHPATIQPTKGIVIASTTFCRDRCDRELIQRLRVDARTLLTGILTCCGYALQQVAQRIHKEIASAQSVNL